MFWQLETQTSLTLILLIKLEALLDNISINYSYSDIYIYISSAN